MLGQLDSLKNIFHDVFGDDYIEHQLVSAPEGGCDELDTYVFVKCFNRSAG